SLELHKTENSRQKLLKNLEACETGKWYRMETFLFAIWKQDPFPLSSTYSPRSSLSLRESREQWMRTGEGQRYLALLSSTLFEAGVVNLGYEHANPGKNPPELFQITPLGALALQEEQISAEQQVSVENKLVVQPSYEIVLFQFDVQ